MLKRPHITEKGNLLGAENVYTFVVDKRATKQSVAKEVMDTYKVKVIGVRVVNLPGKAKMSRGKHGRTPGIKKVYVKLGKGDKVEFV